MAALLRRPKQNIVIFSGFNSDFKIKNMLLSLISKPLSGLILINNALFNQNNNSSKLEKRTARA
jgi:hypothetical protein